MTSPAIGDEKLSSGSQIHEREARLLNRLSAKYADEKPASRIRSYLIASVIIAVMFVLARWIPWWGLALLIVEILGLALFHQYKRFARFKSRLLSKLWLLVRDRAA